MNSKKIITWSIIICIILYLIPNIFYICKFGNTNLSATPSDWGVYGDFIGGSINPILTILNIIALIYLTYTVSYIEGNRVKENINSQKLITLNQMRYDAVSELSKLMDSVIVRASAEYKTNPSTSQVILIQVYFTLQQFKEQNKFLFEKVFTQKFNEDYYQPLLVATKSLNEILSTKREEGSGSLIEIYEKTKAKFFSELNKFILEELSPRNI